MTTSHRTSCQCAASVTALLMVWLGWPTHGHAQGPGLIHGPGSPAASHAGIKNLIALAPAAVGPAMRMADCNSNGTEDADDIANGTSRDCNLNTIPDECDITDGTSLDVDLDGIPDECCFPVTTPLAEMITIPGLGGGTFVNEKQRRLSVLSGAPGVVQAIRVRFVELPPPGDVNNGKTLFVGEPVRYCENSGQITLINPDNPPDFGCSQAGGLPRTFVSATLQCEPHYMDWHGICDTGLCVGGVREGLSCAADADCQEAVHIWHPAILAGRAGFVPNPVYEIQTISGPLCPVDAEQHYSAALVLTTSLWGDSITNAQTTPPGPPNGIADISDVVAILNKFRNATNAIAKVRADIGEDYVDFLVPIKDVVFTLDAFTGQDYPWPVPLIICP